MCYSYRTSILSYTLGMFSAFFAFYTKQYIMGMLILFYCQIQLSEAFIWKGIDDNNLSLNKFGTAYGKYTIPSHVFAVGLGIWLLTGRTVPLLIGLLFYLCVVLYFYREDMPDHTYPLDKNCVVRECQNNNNRLQWPYRPEKWYMYGTFLIFLFIYLYAPTTSQKVIYIGSLSLTYMLSYLFYLKNTKSLSSIWCFLSAIAAPIIVLLAFMLGKETNHTIY